MTPRVRGGEGNQMAKLQFVGIAPYLRNRTIFLKKFQFVGIAQYLRTRTIFLKKQRGRSKIAWKGRLLFYSLAGQNMTV